MTVQEAKTERYQLEIKISELINEYYFNTGAHVTKIDLSYMEQCGERILTTVNIEVKL